MILFLRSLAIMLFLMASLSFSRAEAKTFLPATFNASFYQEHKSIQGGGKVKKTPGELDYKYPGHIRIEFKEPSPQLYISNPKKSWYYTPPFSADGFGEVRINPEKRKVASFFDSLTKGLVSNKDYTVKKGKDYYRISFTKKVAEDIGIREAILNFKDHNKASFQDLLAIEMTKLDNKKVIFKFETIKKDIKFSSSHFVFVPPKNTREAHQ